jgi:small subunit ribosomal protein S2
LIDAGIHFGHRAGRWNPKMKPYIFCARNSIHIVDIKETIRGLIRARKFITSVVSSGKDILFVGTKRQARQAVSHHATRVGMPYVSERWLGGTLTNFRTIRARLSRLEELEQMEEQGLLAAESKKMESTLRRELRKIQRNLGGIRIMDKLPGALVVIDARREANAVQEARKLGIPTVALLDTDSDPDLVDLPIPGNDDAMRAIEVVITQLADAVAEGKAARPTVEESAESRPRSRRLTTAQAAEAYSGGHRPSRVAPQQAQTEPQTQPATVESEQVPAEPPHEQ